MTATTAKTAGAAAITVDQTMLSRQTDPIWKNAGVTYSTKQSDGTFHVSVNGKRVARLQPASDLAAIPTLENGKTTHRKPYRDLDNPAMPPMLWRHCLVYIAARYAGVTLSASETLTEPT